MNEKNVDLIKDVKLLLLHKSDSLNCIFRIVGNFEFHATDGVWLVLETENTLMTVGFDGVRYHKSEEDFDKDIYEFDNLGDEEYESLEQTVLKGQQLPEVEKTETGFKLYFNGFSLNIILHNESDPSLTSGLGDGCIPLAVGHHLLTRRCECGGKGEPFIDFVQDYFVRCENCHVSTCASMEFREAVKDWNNGSTPCGGGTETEKFYSEYINKPIKRIVFPKWRTNKIDERSCETDGLIIVFDDTKFGISSSYIGKEAYGFSFSEYSDYNPEMYPHIITSENGIRFLDIETELDGNKTMRFILDDTKLVVLAEPDGLVISIAELWENDFKESKRRYLFDQ